MLKKVISRMKGLRPWQQLILGTAAALLILIIVGFSAVYQFGWQDPVIGAISKIIPLPAAQSSGHTITYASYYDEVKRIGVMNRQVAKQSSSTLSPSDINRQAIGGLINDALIQNYAKNHNVAVSDKDITEARNKIFKEEHGEKNALKVLKDQYGVDKSGFDTLISRNLLRQKVEIALINDGDAQRASKTRLTSVVKALHNKIDFDTVEKQYSQDPTSAMSGEKANVAVKNLPKPVADEVLKIKDGEVAPSPVNVSGKIYLVKRVGTVNNEIQTHIIVVLPVSLNQWLREAQRGGHIAIYIPQAK